VICLFVHTYTHTVHTYVRVYVRMCACTYMYVCWGKKLKLSLYLSKYHAMNRKWSYRSTILNLGNGWMWVVSFTQLPLYFWAKSPCIHWIGGWVGPRAGLDDREKRNISASVWNRARTVQPVAGPYMDWAIPVASLHRGAQNNKDSSSLLLCLNLQQRESVNKAAAFCVQGTTDARWNLRVMWKWSWSFWICYLDFAWYSKEDIETPQSRRKLGSCWCKILAK
jgi:hypothetical protein